MCPLTALIPGTKPLKSRLRVVAVFGIKSEEAAYFHPSLFRGRCEWNQKKWLKLIFCSSCCRHQSKVGDVLAFFLWIFLYLSRIRAVIWLEIHLKMPISFHIWLETSSTKKPSLFIWVSVNYWCHFFFNLMRISPFEPDRGCYLTWNTLRNGYIFSYMIRN